MTQRDRVINYIEQFGEITPIEAFRDLGITKLATRISEMIKDGIEIEKEFVKSKNRFGETVYYMKYSFPKEGDKEWIEKKN